MTNLLLNQKCQNILQRLMSWLRMAFTLSTNRTIFIRYIGRACTPEAKKCYHDSLWRGVFNISKLFANSMDQIWTFALIKAKFCEKNSRTAKALLENARSNYTTMYFFSFLTFLKKFIDFSNPTTNRQTWRKPLQ